MSLSRIAMWKLINELNYFIIAMSVLIQREGQVSLIEI